jgi:hypothetical protein
MLLQLPYLLTTLHKSLYTVNWQLTLTGTLLAESVFIICTALHASHDKNKWGSSENLSYSAITQIFSRQATKTITIITFRDILE